MRAKIDLARRTVRDHACRARYLIEQDAWQVRGHAVREAGDREYRAGIGIGDLVRCLHSRSERIDEHRATSFRRGERREDRRRRGEENRGPSPTQRAHERRAPLQQRQPGGNELLSFDAVDMTATGGDCYREKAERVAHGREA